MHHVIIVTISLAFLVLIAGLFLLAYSKKEQLGFFTKLTSYIAIAFGLTLIVGSLICMLTCGNCHQNNCQNKCKVENQQNCKSNCEVQQNAKCTGNSENCMKQNCETQKECSKNPECKEKCEKLRAEGKEDCCGKVEDNKH